MTVASEVLYASFSRTRVVIGAAALLVALVASGVAGRHHRLAAVALAAVSLAWLVFDSVFEGPTLIEFDQAHGLTAGDLPGLAGLLLAAWQLRPWRRTSTR